MQGILATRAFDYLKFLYFYCFNQLNALTLLKPLNHLNNNIFRVFLLAMPGSGSQVAFLLTSSNYNTIKKDDYYI